MPRWLQRMDGIPGRLDEADVLAGMAEHEGDRWGGAGMWGVLCLLCGVARGSVRWERLCVGEKTDDAFL